MQPRVQLLPPQHRDKLLGWLSALNFGFSITWVMLFPMFELVGLRVLYAGFAIVAAAVGGIFAVALPETLGADLERLYVT